MKLSTKNMIRISIAVALIAIGAQIRIPSPVAGYFTMQLPFVIMTATILGSKNALIACLVYIIGGLIGIPWFAAGGGFGYVIQPTFGFIFAFAIGALIAGKSKHVSFKKSAVFSILATISIWFVGMIYMTALNQLYFGKTVSYIAAVISIFSIDFAVDIILAFSFTWIGHRINKMLER